MGKNRSLDELFIEWRAAIGPEVDHFISDGIIDEDQYLAQDPKILFLGKDPHETKSESWDFRKEWPKDPEWKHAKQVKRWAYGILNGFPPWEQALASTENVLLKVACMNIKKTGGGPSSVYGDIEHHATRHASLIQREVQIIDPDIIIGGLRGYGLWDVIVGKAVEMDVIEGVGVFRWNKVKVLDFFHPSNRFPHSMSYALLSRVIQSERFKRM